MSGEKLADSSPGPSGLRKRKREVYSKRFLTEKDLEELLEKSSESELDFSSDDDIQDKNYSPSKESTSESPLSVAEEETLSNSRSESERSMQVALTPGNSPLPINDNVDENLWTDTEEDPLAIPFLGNPGIKVDIPPDADPIYYFSLFFDESIFEIITTETNRRANEFFQSRKRRSKREQKWKDVTVAEMKKFIGICCLGGTVVFPLLAKQWIKHPLYYHPIFGQTISRNRFQLILRMFRCVNHHVADQKDRIFKVRPILQKILENIKSTFYPDQNLSIDEAMIGWQGRLSFKQYISNKRHKYGIKLYELTTHDGFILNVLVYTGKGTLQEDNKPHAHAVVETLLADYLDKGHTVYLDNFYNSVGLAEALLEKNTLCVGTLRENRKGNPKEIVKKKLKKGEAVWKRKGRVLVTNWRDKRNVRMISTKHKHEMIEMRAKRGNKMKPLCVEDYNKNMSGIDRSDQMIAYYSTPRKTVRWYRKVFFHLIDLSIWNGFYIYQKVNGPNTRLLEFREKVILSLLGNKKSDTETKSFTLENFHFLEPNPPTEKDKSAMLRCRQCKKRKTRYFCPVCEIRPGLCVHPCFKDYHTTN